METIKTIMPIIKEESITLDLATKVVTVGKNKYIVEKGVMNLLQALISENAVMKDFIEYTKGIDTDIEA